MTNSRADYLRIATIYAEEETDRQHKHVWTSYVRYLNEAPDMVDGVPFALETPQCIARMLGITLDESLL